MKITKYVHSCLLVEVDHLSVLIDPGSYTWDSHLLNPNLLPQLSHIVITHEHSDHYHEPALRALSQRFPHAVIVTNNDLAKKVKDLQLPNKIASGSDDDIKVFEAPHASLPLKTAVPLNIGVHIADKLTHSGDALKFSHTRDILALPLTGPFASYKQSLDAIVKLKPKIVLPMHDWEWHKNARQNRYDRAVELLKPLGIEFMPLENTETVEL